MLGDHGKYFFLHEKPEDETTPLGVIRHNLKQTVLALVVYEKLGVWEQHFTGSHTLSLIPCHILRYGAVFLLREVARHNLDEQLALLRSVDYTAVFRG